MPRIVRLGKLCPRLSPAYLHLCQQMFFSSYGLLALPADFLYKSLVRGVYPLEFMIDDQQCGWCEAVYHAKAAGLLLYGRALGLSHGEAEDVLQETFLALIQKAEAPSQPEYYCLRSFRNRALNYRRSLWRRLSRELESQRWFERSAPESPHEREAMHCLAQLPPGQREVIVLKIWQLCVLYNQRVGDSLGGGTHSGHIVAMILSNQSAVAYLPAGFQRDQNSPPVDTFEWTNGSGSTSSVRSLSAPKAQD